MANVEMIFWDVQHGNAVFIRTPNNRVIVIDLGIGDYSGHDQNFSPLLTLYNTYGIRTIDLLVVTHPHLDHIDDILNLAYFHVRSMLRPNHLTRSEIMVNIREADRPKYERYCTMSEGMIGTVTGTTQDISVPANYGGISYKHFDTTDLPRNNLNNHSILSVIEYSGFKIVIPGDNECASLTKLMEREDFKAAIKDCDILLAPHHGRESAYHTEFVSLANPRITIVSDGSICDTSANPRYSASSRGWAVFNKGTSNSTDRKLLTTNSDGEIYVTFGPPSNGGNRFLNIQIP